MSFTSPSTFGLGTLLLPISPSRVKVSPSEEYEALSAAADITEADMVVLPLEASPSVVLVLVSVVRIGEDDLEAGLDMTVATM